ncbi:unnamed protein product [Bursaphelenchus xylophilus]|uniref:(pine wood nematode) hypothetical protein n=1 Tax=Bursaphelenchus xylophilus TaxID=6326 RepID=A0A7I8XHS1_BURXY|nr:unnamed protein product [Bursaphelenchus xylophilus]CAG9079612.1 unnamed protein product [Bursaphelenchus xylophilus]
MWQNASLSKWKNSDFKSALALFDVLELQNKIRQIRVRAVDGSTVKTVNVDESKPVKDLMVTICGKMGLSNHEEYSLVRDARFAPLKRDQSLSSLNGDQQYNGNNTFMNTIGRRREKQVQQLRAKLHTDDDVCWLDSNRTLREQGIGEGEELILRRKFFVSDTNLNTNDPAQLGMLYAQCRDGVLDGTHPVSREIAIKLAALQCAIEFGEYQEGVEKKINMRDLLPKEYAKAKEHEKNIVDEWKELIIYNEKVQLQKKYCEVCQSLPTYGVTFFLVKEKVPGKNKLIPRLLGVNKDSVLRVDEKSKQVLKEWPLEQVRRYAPGAQLFTLDFGDYKDGYYCVKTPDGEKIAALISGYIDIILKKKKLADHLGIEGDEGSTMLEDQVAPARATLIGHGEITRPQQLQGLPQGALRSRSSTPSGLPNGAQYGAVSGYVTTQEMPRGERVRYVNPRERAQRALIGTIEATIRAVQEAEEEIQRPPQIDLLRFEPSRREWRVEVEKEAVSDRLAAMGAATAEVVQLTAIPDDTDSRVGTAIATIGSNLPEMGRGVRELAHMMPEEERRGDLIEASRRLMNAFGTFIDKVRPDQNEKRANILSAASAVGETSHDVIKTMRDETHEDRQYHDQLIQRARNVATNTAGLVMHAKTISSDCGNDGLKERVINSATQTAFATSELVACTRVVAPTIEHPSSQERLTEAAQNVSRTVETLVEHSREAVQHSRSGNGQNQIGDLTAAARQVTHALDDLIDHIRTSPRGQGGHRRHEENYNYEEVLRSSNRVITGAQPQRDANQAIRHSRILVEQFENGAEADPNQRDKLLNAARNVAQATSNMITATQEAQSRPQEAEAQIALKSAAENLVQATNAAANERIAEDSFRSLERAAKNASAAVTQTVSAVNSAQPHIHNHQTVEELIIESQITSNHVRPVITAIKESQAAATPSDRFRAQSSLIYETEEFLPPASQLVDLARRAVPEVKEPHSASNLQSTSQKLSTELATLRTTLNKARQLNYNQQLDHTEELIRELDQALQQTNRDVREGHIRPTAAAGDASQRLNDAARQVSSTLTQLVSAAQSADKQHVGASAMDVSNALRRFTYNAQEIAPSCGNNVDTFIGNTRNVVHDSGNIFVQVRNQASPSRLRDSLNTVQASIRQTLNVLPDHASIEEAVKKIAQAEHVQVSTSLDLRQAAGKLIEAASELIAGLRAPEQRGRVDHFVEAYITFFAVTRTHINEKVSELPVKREILENLEISRNAAINVLERFSGAQLDPQSLVHTQQLSQSARQLSESVTTIVNITSQEAPWVKECDNALRKIEAVRPILNEAIVPQNHNSYYESLDAVTEEAKRLGSGLSGMAHHARHGNGDELYKAVHQAGDAVCGLAENAVQSAYLIGAGHPQSVGGRPALFDVERLNRNLLAIQAITEKIVNGQVETSDLVAEMQAIAAHASNVAQICRDATERTSSSTTKKQFTNCARDITDITSKLIAAVKKLQAKPESIDHQQDVNERALELNDAAHTLAQFVDRPDFTPNAAKISAEGRQSQEPLLQSGRQMLDASAKMFSTAKKLAVNATDANTWQEIADNSRVVSESIKNLVTTIRDQAPGQADLDLAIEKLGALIRQLDRAALDAAQDQLPRSNISEQRVHQQIVYCTQTLLEHIDPLKAAAKSHAEQLGHEVREHVKSTETLVQSAVQAASLSYDSDAQNKFFEQCKTVVEAELKLMIAAKDAGGNPKAEQLHSVVDEWANQLRRALSDLERSVNLLDSQAGVIHGIVETITRSIAITDQSKAVDPSDSFPNVQARMVEGLEKIRKIAEDMPVRDVEDLGKDSLTLAELYRTLAEDGRVATSLLTNSDLSYKLKVSVQRLGTTSIELVRVAGQRRSHPYDERIRHDLQRSSEVVVERCEEVLAALYEGSRGTQACINAANTVSGIIGDLDTTILFATSGSLNPASPQHQPQSAKEHRDTIVRTAKALIEDTKALVTGAASNQEQLAVAAQNSVRTIMQLTEAVRRGASVLSKDSQESRVLVFHACRDVAASLSNLINATNRASGRNPQDPAMSNLKDAAKTMVINVSNLLKTVKSFEEQNRGGAYALEAAMDAIDFAVRQYDLNESPKRTDPATAEDVIRATREVTEASTRATTMASALDTERVIAASNFARKAVADLLSTTLSASLNADTPELGAKTKNAGREVAIQVKQLLQHLLAYVAQPANHSCKELILLASQEVSNSVGILANCCEALRSNWSTERREPQNAIEAAENELLGAASSIEAAAERLQHLKPRHQVQNPDQELEFDVHIISYAKQITNAVSALVKAARSTQRELVQQGRIDPRPQQFKGNDYQWSEGFVSAAKAVAAAVQQLCETANSVVAGHASEEKLAACAKTVAAHTAQLLVACRVKADQGSHNMQRLQSAGQAVRVAAESLVNAARQRVADDERIVVINDRMVHGIAQVMKAQEEVIRKERELTEARRQLAQVNKSRYAPQDSDEDAA